MIPDRDFVNSLIHSGDLHIIKVNRSECVSVTKMRKSRRSL